MRKALIVCQRPRSFRAGNRGPAPSLEPSFLRRASSSRRVRRGGFTLPEVLCSITLLVVGAFTVFALITLSIKCDMEAADFTRARAIAATAIETLRMSQNTPTSSTMTSAYMTSNLCSGATGTVTVTTPSWRSTSQTPISLVTVTITWPEPARGTVTLTVNTYICSGGVSTS